MIITMVTLAAAQRFTQTCNVFHATLCVALNDNYGATTLREEPKQLDLIAELCMRYIL